MTSTPAIAQTTPRSTPLRQKLNLNREWRFLLGDHPGAEAGGFSDSEWETIGLPHSFSLPYFASPHFYTGYGWYRKSFTVPEAWAGKHLFIEFEGVFQDAEVFVNGQPVGRHVGGYTGFSFDITKAPKPGENVLAVRVNNLWRPDIAPRAGEHVFSGGIYRDVYLTVTEPLHVPWYGTFITTPQVSKDAATVNIKTEVTNASTADRNATVRTIVLDPSGRAVAEIESSQVVPAGQTVTFNQTTPAISHPLLWHPDHPHLYSVKTTVLQDGKPSDEVASPLGIRWFEWTKDKGFFLNGEHFYIYGANVHQDHAGWGDAVTNAGFERDVQMVKDAGFNLIRGSHYPHDPAFSAACDRIGMLLWSENDFWGIGGFNPDGDWTSSAYPPRAENQPGFEASVIQQLEEMIRIHRNHPSVVAWSMGNETFFTHASVMPQVSVFLKKLVAHTHELDATRPAAVGGVQRPLDDTRIDLIGDVAGYNGDGASLPPFQNPGVPNIVAEYSSTTAVRPGTFDPGWDQIAAENGNPVHPWRSGQVIWCMFDHGSIAGFNLGRMGIVDYFRIPKRAWYWYQNEYRHIAPPQWPVEGKPAKLRLTADKTTLNSVDGTDDAHLLVTVLDADGNELSNAVPVTLELISGPGEFPTGRSITFAPDSDIAILDGKAAIEFRSYYGGTSVIRATSPGLESADITIISQSEPRWVEGVTAPVKDRPYQRFTAQPKAAGAQDRKLNLASNRPTKASSSADGFSSGNATDGNAATLWKAAPGDRAPWLRVDLENTYTLDRVRLGFPEPGNYRFVAEVTTNGTDWTTIVDESNTDSNTDSIEQTRSFNGSFGSGIRFLRVTFKGWPEGKTAALSELSVGGHTE